jgi:hypothetical protein
VSFKKARITNFEMLLLRACKSREPEQRLNSLMRRFYLPVKSQLTNDYRISIRLSTLVDDYELFTVTDIVSALRAEDEWLYEREGDVLPLNYFTLLKRVLTSKIRHVTVSDFNDVENVRWPAWSKRYIK